MRFLFDLTPLPLFTRHRMLATLHDARADLTRRRSETATSVAAALDDTVNAVFTLEGNIAQEVRRRQEAEEQLNAIIYQRLRDSAEVVERRLEDKLSVIEQSTSTIHAKVGRLVQDLESHRAKDDRLRGDLRELTAKLGDKMRADVLSLTASRSRYHQQFVKAARQSISELEERLTLEVSDRTAIGSVLGDSIAQIPKLTVSGGDNNASTERDDAGSLGGLLSSVDCCWRELTTGIKQRQTWSTDFAAALGELNQSLAGLASHSRR